MSDAGCTDGCSAGLGVRSVLSDALPLRVLRLPLALRLLAALYALPALLPEAVRTLFDSDAWRLSGARIDVGRLRLCTGCVCACVSDCSSRRHSCSSLMPAMRPRISRRTSLVMRATASSFHAGGRDSSWRSSSDQCSRATRRLSSSLRIGTECFSYR